jgi:NAD(P)-dependent dehydrogenase (short-subunit alcohol dehydrogenase family)
MLGEAGATVYCTGRSSRHYPRPKPETDSVFETALRPETIEETAEMVVRFGGTGIPVRVDHSQQVEVRALFERIREEQGRLDILVNDIWGGDALVGEWGESFWKKPLSHGLTMFERAVHTHIITSHAAAPLLTETGNGLLVEITDGDTGKYRGDFFYDLVKNTVIRLAKAMVEDLRPYRVASISVTPGFLRSEAMLEHFGVTEANWREGANKEPHFIASETPFFVGRAIAALAADPEVFQKTGGIFSSWGLSDEYGFTDIDGERPHWGRYYEGV